jgi:hypothetical protein
MPEKMVSEPDPSMNATAVALKPAPLQVDCPPLPAAGPTPEAVTNLKKKKKGPSTVYKGICIHCGERFTLSEEEMSRRSFGFCNEECRMKFQMDLAEEVD